MVTGNWAYIMVQQEILIRTKKQAFIKSLNTDQYLEKSIAKFIHQLLLAIKLNLQNKQTGSISFEKSNIMF